MANSVTGSVKASLVAVETPDSGFFSGKPFSIEQTIQAIFATSGTLADQCNGRYAATLTFASSTPQTIDLRAVTDVFGAALAFQLLRVLLIRVKSTTDAASLTVAPGASNGMTSLIGASSSMTIRAATANNHAFGLWVAPNTTGYAVGSSTKTILLTPSAHAFDVDIIALGVKV